MSQFSATKNPPWVRNNATANLTQPPAPGTSLATSLLAAQVSHAPAAAATGLGAAGAVPTGTLATAAAVVAAQTQQAQQAPAVSAAYGTSLAAISLTQSALQQGAVLQQQGIAIPASLAATTQVATVNSGMVVELARLPQPGVALPTSLATTQVATVSYPAPRLLAQAQPFQATQTHPHQTAVVQQASVQASQQQQQLKQRVFTGIVTKLHDSFGFVDEDVFFQFSAVKGNMPKVGERVLIEAAYNPNMPFKWNATRIQVLPNQVCQLNVQQSNNTHATLVTPAPITATVMAAPVSVGLSLPASVTMNAAVANIAGNHNQFSNINSQGRWQVQQELAVMEPMGQQRIGIQFDNRLDNQNPWIQDMEYSEMVENKAQRMQQLPRRHASPPPSRRDREREARREDRRERYRERERYSPPSIRKRSRSPRRPSRSPPRRRQRTSPRYTVQVPKISLDVKEGNVIELRKRYANLYIPSDFCSASFLWQDAFPPHRPFSLDHPCTFHIMSKDAEPIYEDCVPYATDADHLYSAKVMLMATPPLKEIFKKSCALAEDSDDTKENFVHPTRLISFLIGLKGKNETVAIGGPWSPSLDGPDPDKNPSVLIRTAIRTCKSLTGIDLSKCSQWYRFAEIFYRRGESTHKGRVLPTRVETVVLFLPDVWSCLPTRLEWDGLVSSYKKQLQKKLPIGNQNHEELNENQDDEECGTDNSEKKEATHFSELDPKTIKVSDLKRELEARNLSTKGLKSQLIARLTKALKSESEQEESGEVPSDSVNSNNTEKLDGEECTDEEKKKKDELEKKYKEDNISDKKSELPENVTIIVQPSRTAKGGKFDCAVMSLSLLLDYRQEDNKEHSFEVSLFAELFNEMMMRDFGFRIYRSLAEAPEMKDDDRERKKGDRKDDRKDRKDEKDDRRKDDGDDSDKEDEDSDDEECENDDKKERKRKRRKKMQMYTFDPYLLLSYIYYDQTHCGYLLDKDIEEIFYTLGLQLSRAQVRKLIQKVCKHEVFRYRKLTDKPHGDSDRAVKLDDTTKLNLEELAAGNKKYIPIFKSQSNNTDEAKNDNPNDMEVEDETTKVSNKTQFITYHGALVDIGKLMKLLERSEKARIDTEQRLKNVEEELETVNEIAATKDKCSQKLAAELEEQRVKLYSAEEEIRKLHTQTDKYQRALSTCKDQLHSALTTVDNVLRPKSKSSASKNYDVKKESEATSARELSHANNNNRSDAKNKLNTDSEPKENTQNSNSINNVEDSVVCKESKKDTEQ